MAGYELFQLSFRREDLLKVPEPELKFLLVTAKLLNEICILHRLLIIQHNDLGKKGPDRDGRIAVYMFLLLQLAGKLWEVWQCLQQFYFSAPWNGEHTNQLSDEGKDGLDSLKRAMSTGSPLDTIRNKVAFHADGAFLLEELRSAKPAHNYSAIIASDLLNTMYNFAEELSVRGAIRTVNANVSAQEGIESLFKMVTDVARSALAFLSDAVAVTMGRHGVAELQPESRLSVDDCPDLNELKLPFLVRPLRR